VPGRLVKSKEQAHQDLLDAFGQPECPVCRLAGNDVKRYLDIVLYEMVTNIESREQLRNSRGFCNRHAWQLLDRRDPLGINLIYVDILKTMTAELERTRFGGSIWRRLLRRLSGGSAASEMADLDRRLGPQRLCPACEEQGAMEHVYLEVLIESLAEAPFAEAYGRSAGLCYAHLRQALPLVPDAATFERFKRVQVEASRRLIADLSEFIRKKDYRHAHEEFGAESDAAPRTVGHIIGKGGMR
jgi:hypothetical protein